MSVSQKIEDLITAANAVTGESRTDLTACIQDLKDGYGGGGGLPAEYQEVEYIESTGTQYIDTGYIPNSTDTVEIVADVSSANTGNVCPFGCRGAYQNWVYQNSLTVQFNIDSNTRFHNYRYSEENYISYSGLFDKKAEIISSSHNFLWFALAGTGGARTYTGSTPRQPNKNLYLFGANNANGAGSFIKMKLYVSNIMTENGETTRRFIPCYRISDSVIGMYDLVNRVFYTNAGTGTFTKGADV